MHAYFPHPKDNLIILGISGAPDVADIETIRNLLSDRIEEVGKILVLLEAGCPPDSFALWIASLFDEKTIQSVERLAIVGEATSSPSESWEMLASSVAVRLFASAQREQALNWIQTGEELKK